MKLCHLTYGHIYDLWKLYTFLDPQSRVCLNAREATEKRDSEDVHRMEKRKEFALEIFFLLLNSHKRIVFSLVSERIQSIMNQKKDGFLLWLAKDTKHYTESRA